MFMVNVLSGLQVKVICFGGAAVGALGCSWLCPLAFSFAAGLVVADLLATGLLGAGAGFGGNGL